MIKNRAHAERRAKLEAERAERRRLEEEALNRRRAQKKSASTPCKWYYKKGLQMKTNTGEIVKIKKGFFYAGHNQSEMVSPNIEEPSKIDPILNVSFDAPNSLLPIFPVYQYISDEQRGAYITWLASERNKASDMGYVFMYLYGLERRLIIDTKKPGIVSDEERADLVDEILRLIRCFGSQSSSLAQYGALLLLYDGTLFHRDLSEDTMMGLIDGIFLNDDLTRRFRYSDNTDSYEFMLLGRLTELNLTFEKEDILNYARIKMERARNRFPDIDIKDMYSGEFSDYAKTVYASRYSHSSLGREKQYPEYPITGITKVRGKKIYPIYAPSSPVLRRHGGGISIEDICFDPDTISSIPWKKISDICVSSYDEVRSYMSMLENKSLRGFYDVELDVISAVTFPTELDKYIREHQKDDICLISHQLLADEIYKMTKTDVQSTSRGKISSQAQKVYQKLLSCLGWQTILPESFSEGSIARNWKVNEGTDIVIFNRHSSYHKVSGKQRIRRLMSSNDYNEGIAVSDVWEKPFAALYGLGWFISQSESPCPEMSDIVVLPQQYYVDLIQQVKIKKKEKNRLYSFLTAFLKAAWSYSSSIQSIGTCLDTIGFPTFQKILFRWCHKRYGDLLPEKIIETLERVYGKAGQEKGMVLYDYSLGDFTTEDADEDDEMTFFIDEELKRQTILETTQVHSILSEAFADDDSDESYEDDEDTDVYDDSDDFEIGLDSDPLPQQVGSNQLGSSRVSTDTRNQVNIQDTQDDVHPASYTYNIDEPIGRTYPVGSSDSEHSVSSNSVGSSNSSNMKSDHREQIIAFFDGTDEIESTVLYQKIMDTFGVSTSAEAVSFIARINDESVKKTGEELLEIDGEFTYLNE